MIDLLPPGGLQRLTLGQRAHSWSLPEEVVGTPEHLQHGRRQVPLLWGNLNQVVLGVIQQSSVDVANTVLPTFCAQLWKPLPLCNSSACFPGSCTLQRFTEVSLQKLICLGGQIQEGYQQGSSPSAQLLCLWSALELTNCPCSFQASKSRSPCTHLHLMSCSFSLQPSHWAVHYTVFAGCLAGPRFRLVLRQYCSKL